MRLIGGDLTCERGGRGVFSGVGFAVPAGRALVVTGPNGAGKSSLLRLIAGLVTPVAGTLALEGADGDLSVGQQCHYFGHLDALKPALTVQENLGFWRDFFEAPAGSTTDALQAVGLERLAAMPAAYLSAGQRRRLSFARLLVSYRPVWLLDEPTSALDAASQDRLVAIVAAHLAEGGIVVAATHAPLDFGEPLRLDLSPSARAAA